MANSLGTFLLEAAFKRLPINIADDRNYPGNS